MGPPSSHRITRARWYSGSSRLAYAFAYKTFTFCGASSHTLRLALAIPYAVLNPSGISTQGLASSPFAHHYLGNLFDFFYIRLLRCFTSPTPPPIKTGLRPAPERLPHSDTLGSKVVCTSPRIFAAYRVLHRCQIPKASTVCPYLFTLLNIYCLLFNCQCTRGNYRQTIEEFKTLSYPEQKTKKLHDSVPNAKI